MSLSKLCFFVIFLCLTDFVAVSESDEDNGEEERMNYGKANGLDKEFSENDQDVPILTRSGHVVRYRSRVKQSYDFLEGNEDTSLEINANNEANANIDSQSNAISVGNEDTSLAINANNEANTNITLQNYDILEGNNVNNATDEGEIALQSDDIFDEIGETKSEVEEGVSLQNAPLSFPLGQSRRPGKIWSKFRRSKKPRGEKVKLAKLKKKIVVTHTPTKDSISMMAEQFNISGCPLTYYGKSYEQLYVNSTDDGLFICLDSYFGGDSLGDCVEMPSLKEMKMTVVVSSRVSNHKLLLQEFPSLGQSQAQCSAEVRLSFTDKISVLTMYRFGAQTALHLDAHVSGVTGNVSFYVKGEKRSRWIIDGSVQTTVDKFLLPTACRLGDSVVEPNTIISNDPDTCITTKCDATGKIETSGCKIHQQCIGNHTCSVDLLCSVLGTSVVDVGGRVKQIPNRCSFVLMQTPDFRIEASFRERRRLDVNFIDAVTFRTSNDTFVLEQGGRVSFNGEWPPLSASPHEYNQVEIFKDEFGVTLMKSFQQLSLSLVFDGTTAEITYNGLGLSDFTGLCDDMEHLRENIIHTKDCEVQYQEAPDPSINRTAVEERCEVFLSEPFASCHLEIDPEPYIQVCEATFTVYPDTDEVFCQLLESYTRICSFRLNSNLEDASSTLGCEGALDMCQDIFCSDHEFCGVNVNGDVDCLCRGIFAAPFRRSKSYGLPVVCDVDSVSLSLVACLLQEKGFDHTNLHLRDPSCEGELDPHTHMLSFSFSDSHTCGADITVNGSQIIYRNTVVLENSSPDIITRQTDVHISIDCIYSHPQEQSVSFRVKETSVVQNVVGVWNYTLKTMSYLDRSLSTPVSAATEIQLDQRIWLELLAVDLKPEKFHLVMDACWATDTPRPTGALRHELILDGCSNPSDGTVSVEKNGVGSSCVFGFSVFQFTGQSGRIYLHCTLHLCAPKPSAPCAPLCSRSTRTRRSTKQKQKEHPTLQLITITMSFQG